MDLQGRFQERFERWFAEVRVLAERYEALEAAAGKMFAIVDVDPHAGYLSDPTVTGRQQPSAGEFMASITLRVATHLELLGASRSGPRVPTRPDAAEFDKSLGVDVAGARGSGEGGVGLVPEEGAPAGDCLLYTSPSPRDLSTSRMASSA